jgi:uncharacterized iron-regulated membrane protein
MGAALTATLLTLHRWIALIFAIPLAVVLVTGLVLSFEPSLVVGSVKPGTLTADKVEALLARHDPQGSARVLVHRSYDGTLTIGGGRGRGGTIVDTASGEVRSGTSTVANVLTTMRRMHETLLIDAGWLVTASTAAMLVLAMLGILMGLPRLSNTLSGWHKGMAWGLLPLVVLSPLTGLFLAMGITFQTPPARAPGGEAGASKPMSLVEAVRVVGKSYDLSGLVWIRQQRGRLLARVVEDGEYRVLAVTAGGTRPTGRNWPRLIHEGNFAGHWSALMNVVTSIALVGLLGTGVWMWSARQLRRRWRRVARAAAAE